MNIYKVAQRSVVQLPKAAAPAVNSLLTPSSNAYLPSCGIKDHLKARGIVWKEPKKVKFYDPLKTCDLKPFDAPDKTCPTIWMRHALEEYDEAPVIVQQLLSVEFAPRNHLLTVAKYNTMRKVQRHQYDSGSFQAQIGKFTCFIRYMQLPENKFYLDKYPERRVALKFIIDRRQKYLKIVRRNDYKLFEWLLEELDIIYKPRPLTCGTIYRYDSSRKLVKMSCKNLREKKLAAYKAELAERKPAFLKKKYETLRWIKETEEKLGLPPSVDPEKGIIKPKMERRRTVWDRIFGPFIDDKPLRDFDWQYPEDWNEKTDKNEGGEKKANRV